MLKSLSRLLSLDTGIDARNVLSLRMAMPPSSFQPDSAWQFYAQVLEQVSQVPGVSSAALGNCPPLNGGCNGTTHLVPRSSRRARRQRAQHRRPHGVARLVHDARRAAHRGPGVHRRRYPRRPQGSRGEPGRREEILAQRKPGRAHRCRGTGRLPRSRRSHRRGRGGRGSATPTMPPSPTCSSRTSRPRGQTPSCT